MDPIAPFNPTLLVILGAAAVIGGFVAVDKWQEYRTKSIYRREKLEGRDDDEKRITKIVSEAFTGRAEADHHFRAEALNNYKTVLREALDDHAKDERRYIDTLRDKITEYHAVSLQAIQDAKRVAMHVSSEYAEIKKRLGELEREMEQIRVELRALGPQSRIEE